MTHTYVSEYDVQTGTYDLVEVMSVPEQLFRRAEALSLHIHFRRNRQTYAGMSFKRMASEINARQRFLKVDASSLYNKFNKRC